MDDTSKSVTARIGHHVLVGALAASAAVVAPEGVAAADIFLKLADIEGESADDKHKAEIGVLAWSWGVNTSSTDSKGKVVPACSQPLHVRKSVDKATPRLVAATARSQLIATGKLTVRRSGENPIEFLVIDLAGVTVKSVTNDGGTQTDTSEGLVLGFSSAIITYTPQLLDGSGGPKVSETAPGSCP
jgi:type VI secretion system secreted protein Hcp